MLKRGYSITMCGSACVCGSVREVTLEFAHLMATKSFSASLSNLAKVSYGNRRHLIEVKVIADRF